MNKAILNGLLHERLFPLVLLLVCFFCYGLFIPQLGFYWDGWFKLWLYHSLGFPGLRDFFPSNRPFQFWITRVLMPWFGEDPLRWQLFALFTRWLSAVGMWWTLRGIWPRRSLEAACAALLFAVYPGFSQQPIALVYGPNTFVPLIFFIVSLGAMVWALRVMRWFWPLTILALICMALSMAVTEYFVGLELLRPVILWMILSESIPETRSRLRSTIRNWTPYLAVVGVLLLWRVFLFKSNRPTTSQQTSLAAFLAHPLADLKTRLVYAISDVFKSALMAWNQTINQDVFNFHGYADWLALALTLAGATALAVYLLLLRTRREVTPSTDIKEPRWNRWAIGVGLLAIVLSGLPIWAVKRHVTLMDADDRYTIPAMFGVCILVVGLIDSVIKTRRQKVVLISIIAGLAVGFHVRNSNRYRLDWQAQKSLFWQLSWRAPNLKPGTALLIDDPPLIFSGDYSLSAPLNFVYDSQHSSAGLNYWLFNLSERPVPLASNTELKREIGPLHFTGSTSKSLLLWFSPPSCLRIVDPRRDEVPQLSPLARAALPLSRLDLIGTDPGSSVRPPANIFGAEPEHTWCYYFQKADLARQKDDVNEVTRIGDEAIKRGLKPADATEWLPFVEAYSSVARYEDARKVAQLVLQDDLARPVLCGSLNRQSGETGSASSKQFIDDMSMSLACSQPPVSGR